MSDTNLTISTNSLSQTLDVHQITPEYFILHYAEFIRRVVAKGNPSDDTMRHYCNQIDFFIRWCLSHERNPLAMNEYQLIMYREFLLNRQYKPDSIQVMIVAVKAFYAAATQPARVLSQADSFIQRTRFYVREGGPRHPRFCRRDL